LIVIIGSNMAEAHPVTFDRLRASRRARPEQRLVVIDPRRTPTATHADLHLPVAPGGDIALLNAVGRELVLLDAIDRRFTAAHTAGFEEYRRFLLDQDPAELCAAAGLRAEEIAQLAHLIASAHCFISF